MRDIMGGSIFHVGDDSLCHVLLLLSVFNQCTLCPLMAWTTVADAIISILLYVPRMALITTAISMISWLSLSLYHQLPSNLVHTIPFHTIQHTWHSNSSQLISSSIHTHTITKKTWPPWLQEILAHNMHGCMALNYHFVNAIYMCR